MRCLQDNDNNPNGNVLNNEKNNQFIFVLRLRNVCVEMKGKYFSQNLVLD